MKIKNNVMKPLLAALLAGSCLSAHAAHAGSLYVFGDSLSDDGNTIKFGIPYPPPPYSNFRFSNGNVWSQYFGPLSGLTVSSANNYAVGGAFAGPLSILGTTYNNLENLPAALGEPGFATQLPSFLTQVGEFEATGQKFSSADVVSVWVGANDYFATLALVNAGLEPSSAINTAVLTVAEQTAAGVSALNALGAQRFLIFNLPPLGETPEFNADGPAIVAETNAISAGHNSTLSDFLGGIHGSTGANIIVVNESQIFSELLANPAAYGKTNTTQACITVAACVTASTAAQNQYVFWDAVHPTTGTHLIIAQYAAGLLNGLASLAAPAQIGAAGADAFSGALNARLESLRAGESAFVINTPGAAGTVGAGGKLSGFLSETYESGNRTNTAANSGFTYDNNTVTLGADDRLAPGIAVGGALGYGTDHGSLNSSGGTVSGSAYQLGLYAAFFQPTYYLDLSVALGADDYKTSRDAVLAGSVGGKPAGSSTVLSAETGYVFSAGTLTYGPVAGLQFTDVGLRAYTETGDAALTQSVGAQTFNQTIADIGATAAIKLGAWQPHITATADHLLSGNGGNFNSNFADEPTVQLTTSYGGATKTWGEISGGLSAALNSRTSVSLDAATTVGKTDGEDHEVSGDLRVAF
jgi:outer membrane lipase/esterase